MSERKRFLILIIIMVTVSVIVAGTSISMLYRTAFNEQEARLVETAQSQARLIEAVARFNAAHEIIHPGAFPGGPTQATLSQIIDAHNNYTGFGETGEFTLSKKEGDHMVFLLSHRHYDLDRPKPIPLNSELAEPMRQALSGKSGTIVGLDYRGETVLAAHEPVGELNLGIVAKIDMSEIRAPFMKAGATAGFFAFVIVLIGTSLFMRISRPIIRNLEDRATELEKINHELKREIDQHIQTQKALKDSEEKFSKVFLNSPVAITLTNIKDGLYLDVNESFVRTFGWEREEVTGRTSTELGLWSDAKDREELMKLLSEKESIKAYELILLTKHGESLNFLVSLDIVDLGGEKCLISVAVDITDRKLAEEKIKSSLKEKEVLLSEIHHRVKNNMQVIISLLRLRADKIEDKKYADMFKEGEERIKSMSLIHEQLYQSRDFSNIDFGEYVKSLVNGLSVSYGIDTNKIRLNMEIKDILFDLENAIPCGLIINELVSNSFKYAFSQGKGGTINIGLRSINENEFELIVSDDGVGIPKDLDLKKPDSMGMQLVKKLAEHQLDGKIELSRTEGTRFQINFKRAPYKPRI